MNEPLVGRVEILPTAWQGSEERFERALAVVLDDLRDALRQERRRLLRDRPVQVNGSG
jgi:hypothetical protein